MQQRTQIKKVFIKSREIPCLFLGEPTGELRKVSCKTQPTMIEHWCAHVKRQNLLPINSRREEERFVQGRCTPKGMSHEFRSRIPIQPCYLCGFYQPLQ